MTWFVWYKNFGIASGMVWRGCHLGCDYKGAADSYPAELEGPQSLENWGLESVE